jgi:uncharacterized membrane protein YgaE (UPF0421/DUF939 family)
MHPLYEQLKSRLSRWRSAALPIAQVALAAGLAWLVAVHVADHRSPYFAPVAAVICLGVTLGPRLRRGVELVAGVTIGIGIGDLLISAIGTGPWQIALVVALAMSVAILLDGGPVITSQSAVSAVLVATLYLPGHTSSVNRMINALIGGVLALTVAALLPGNPLTIIHRHAGRVLGELANALRGVATAIKERDADQAAEVLRQARDNQRFVADFKTALQTAAEIAMIAPIRWHRRPQLERYVTLVTPADYAFGNTRGLIRRAIAALRDGEALPHALAEAIAKLADAVDLLSTELAQGKDPAVARSGMRSVAASARAELIGDGGLSASVVLEHLRSTTVDLLQATGMTRDEALSALAVTESKGAGVLLTDSEESSHETVHPR